MSWIEGTGSHRGTIDILCFRHGETLRNSLGLIQGRDDNPETQLTEKGREQTNLTGEQLSSHYPDICTFYTSPLGRCLETAQIVSKYFKNAEIIQRKELIGIDHGEHDGMRYQVRNAQSKQAYEELFKIFSEDHPNEAPDLFFKWKYNPLKGAETIFSVWERTFNAFINIAEENIQNNSSLIAMASTTVPLQSLMTRSDYEYGRISDKVLPVFFELPKSLPNGVILRFRYHSQENKLEKNLSLSESKT